MCVGISTGTVLLINGLIEENLFPFTPEKWRPATVERKVRER